MDAQPAQAATDELLPGGDDLIPACIVEQPGGAHDFWKVWSSGDDNHDFSRGQMIGRQVLAFSRDPVIGPRVIAWVIAAMVHKGRVGSVEWGALSVLSTAASAGSRN